jgi:hypothetical protein
LGAKYGGFGGKDQVPGPGAYGSGNPNLAQHPAVKIGTSKRSGYAVDINPGPGSYASSRPFSAGPRYGFSRSEKKIHDEVTPGRKNKIYLAGQYELKDFLDLEKSRGVTLTNKHEGGHNTIDYTPGPGQYNLATSVGNRPKTPGVRIGTAGRSNKFDTKTPGPGQYFGNYRERDSHGVKIGTSQRSFGLNNQSTPGPGAYDLNYNKYIQGITISGSRYGGTK